MLSLRPSALLEALADHESCLSFGYMSGYGDLEEVRAQNLDADFAFCFHVLRTRLVYD